MSYSSFFEIDPEYFPAVTSELIKEKPELWKKFYPHDTFVSLLRTAVDLLERKKKQSVWVEGAYGTGKSHAVLTLKHLIDADVDETEEYFKKHNISSDLLNRFKAVKDSEQQIITAHRYASSGITNDGSLSFFIQESIERALKERGIENKAEGSIKAAILKAFENNRAAVENIIKENRIIFNGETLDSIEEKLRTYEGQALADIFARLCKFEFIEFIINKNKDICEWIRDVIKSNNLKSIIFIWDEFSEYLMNNARNLTLFQRICELSETEPFHFIIVAHFSEANLKDADFKKLNDRFVKPHIKIELPDNIAIQLMGAALEKTDDPERKAEWEEIKSDLSFRTDSSREFISRHSGIKGEELENILPIHPYSALVLKHISSAYQSNQRSMFDFIKNDNDETSKGFKWFIKNSGPYSDNPLLTIDLLWNFFYQKGGDLLDSSVKNILSNFDAAERNMLNENQKRILKAILMLYAISYRTGENVELFEPSEKNLTLAFEGSDLENGVPYKLAESLVDEKILYKEKNGKYRPNGRDEDIDYDELEGHKKTINITSILDIANEPLKDGSSIFKAFEFSEILSCRYKAEFVNLATIERKMPKKLEKDSNAILLLICLSKTHEESIALGKKIRDIIKNPEYEKTIDHVVFADVRKYFAEFDEYRDAKAYFLYYLKRDRERSSQYNSDAMDALKSWRNGIKSGRFFIHYSSCIDGRSCSGLEDLYICLEDVSKDKYNCAPEHVFKGFYAASSVLKPTQISNGIKLAADEKTSGLYSAKLSDGLKGAWHTPKYWEKSPSLQISRIKKNLDFMIEDSFEKHGRCYISEVWRFLSGKPYGFTNTNLSAFIAGFLMKEYAKGSYVWSDGVVAKALFADKLGEMLGNVMSGKMTPREHYFSPTTKEEAAFHEASEKIFDIPKGECADIATAREKIRSRMECFKFPMWPVEYIPEVSSYHAKEKALRLLKLFIGIVNPKNISGDMNETEIAMEIGRLCMENPSICDFIAQYANKDACIRGLREFLKTFENGRLLDLSSKISDRNEYINAIASKFDAKASGWLWDKFTAEEQIRDVILEYETAYETNNAIGTRCSSFAETVREWLSRCSYIKLSYDACKDNLEDMQPLFAKLCDIKRNGKIADKKGFIELLKTTGKGFMRVCSSQESIALKSCIELAGIPERSVREILLKLPDGCLTMGKDEYRQRLLEKAKEWKKNELCGELLSMWEKCSGTKSPRAWSFAHKMPVIFMVPDEEAKEASRIFGIINNATMADDDRIRRAIAYLKSHDVASYLSDKAHGEMSFRSRLLKAYSDIIDDISDVQGELFKRISDPDSWISDINTDRIIRQFVKGIYDESGYLKALEKIDSMNPEQVKRYLKEMIRYNMNIGIEIIKEK